MQVQLIGDGAHTYAETYPHGIADSLKLAAALGRFPEKSESKVNSPFPRGLKTRFSPDGKLCGIIFLRKPPLIAEEPGM